MQRQAEQLAEREFDVLVVGAGVFGACIAHDASLRGLSVALVDRGDFGGGASANSLRIVHGGLRYLQQFNLRRMRCSIRERATWLRIAPHLVRPLRFVVPTHGLGARSRSVFGAAFAIDGLVGMGRNRGLDPLRCIPRGRVLNRDEACAVLGELMPENATGAALWHDAQMIHSERLTLAVVQSAHAAGAVAVNYVEVQRLLSEGSRVVGAKARDVLTGAEFSIRSSLTVNAAGPHIARLSAVGDGPKLVRGVNLLTRRLAGDVAVGLRGRGGRMVFITPYGSHSLVGTDYLPYVEGRVGVDAGEVERFIAEIRESCPAIQLELDDVCAVQVGCIPVANGPDEPGGLRFLEDDIVVYHERDRGPGGLISVAGTKYTTARATAERVVDELCRTMGVRCPCATEKTPLWGGDIEGLEEAESSAVGRWGSLANPERIHNMFALYGTQLGEVSGATCERSAEVVDASGVLKAQVLYAVRCEMAVKLVDVVFRRTDLASQVITPTREGENPSPIEIAGATMAAALGWSDSRLKKELEEVGAVLDWRRGDR